MSSMWCCPRNSLAYSGWMQSAHKLTQLTYSQAHTCSLHAYLLTSSHTLLTHKLTCAHCTLNVLTSSHTILTHKLTGAHCMLTCSQAHSAHLLTSPHVLTACLFAHKLTHLTTYSQAHMCSLHAYCAQKLTHLTYSQAHRCSLHAYLLTSSLSSLTHKLTRAHCMPTCQCSQAHSAHLLTSSHVLTACMPTCSQAHTPYLLTSSQVLTAWWDQGGGGCGQPGGRRGGGGDTAATCELGAE